MWHLRLSPDTLQSDAAENVNARAVQLVEMANASARRRAYGLGFLLVKRLRIAKQLSTFDL
jgi:hypothetical protein